ncbi:hypothetical protein [Streptomyces sp. NPDC091371]|uniref:hypothetical protein n=1 Tax=Streptomyces sp. NPDC091371 TaxID=3155303 RepID=UPI0034393CC5
MTQLTHPVRGSAGSAVRSTAAAFLDLAEAQLGHLPTSSASLRREWHLKVLRTALKEINALQPEWLGVRDTLPVSTRPGIAEYNEPLTDRNAEAWAYLAAWAFRGQSVIDIESVTRVMPYRPATSTMAPALPSTTGSAAWRGR